MGVWRKVREGGGGGLDKSCKRCRKKFSGLSSTIKPWVRVS